MKQIVMGFFFLFGLIFFTPQGYAAELRIATFQVDATPPLGSPLCGGAVTPAESITDPLSARGVILLPEGQDPIVLCAVDWVGIANGGHDAWREALSRAVNTPMNRVMVHTLHQHDAPFCDFSTEALLEPLGLGGRMFNVEFAREVVKRVSEAAAIALNTPRPVTHMGTGKAKVHKVASNRRIMDEAGKVRAVRWTTCTDPALRAEPEGTIDPWLRSISFWNGEEPVLVMTSYATHPQSYYGHGQVNADFPGRARRMCEEAMPSTTFIHFDGAGGNIGAGKYNDGSPENRPVLAQRLADGMKEAFENTTRVPLNALDITWDVAATALPPREEIDLNHERSRVNDPAAKEGERLSASGEIVWMERCKDGHRIDIGRLRIGSMQMLFLPGELFVEYQLASQALAPDDFVCMAAYGDYGPGYIGTAIAYGEGGYETGLYVSRTAPSVEGVLLSAIQSLLSR